ncbi:MAG: glycosyltransferase family 39 protein [Acidobacteria bacterium]|nr:glycosyltransferase family 39 protein [Acidobacteriota bacterium]
MSGRYSLLGFPERLDRWRRLLPYALLLSVTLALYATTLYFDFVWDDDVYVRKNYRIQGLSPLHLQAIWSNIYLGHYAPIQHTFLAILHHCSGMEPFGYHLGQLLIHAACVCLLYFLLKKLEAPRVALLASLLFAVHPTNIETVAWVSETKSTLAFLFFLLSFWAFLRFRDKEHWSHAILCALFLVLSWLSKINTIVAPAIFFLYDYRQGTLKKRQLKSLTGFFLLSAIFVAIHLASFYKSGQALEETYYEGPGVHLLNIPLILSFYFRMVVFPHPLSAWQMMLVFERWNWILIVGWLALLGLGWLIYWANRTIQFWALWFFFFLLPVLGIVPFGIWVADRYLYIPAIGIFVLVSQLFFWIGDRLPRLAQRVAWELAMAGILLAFGWHTWNHLPVWRDDIALWEDTTQRCMTSAYCHTNLGLAHLRQGHVERGVKELIRAVEIRPVPRYLIFLGDAYTMSVGDYRQALIAYNMAREQGGADIDAEFYAKLARYYLLAGDLPLARETILEGEKLDANDPGLLVMNGVLEWKLGNFDEARLSLRRALVITQRRSNPAGFFSQYWPRASDIGRLLSDLRPQSEPRP